jgi:hypothetical protein
MKNKDMLTNYLYAPQYLKIEEDMLNSVTQTDLDIIWERNKTWIQLMKADKKEYILYDMLHWYHQNLREKKYNVRAKIEAAKGS